MTYDQVCDLIDRIKEESTLKPKTRQLANGDYVVLLRFEGFMFHLWSMNDWQSHKRQWASRLYVGVVNQARVEVAV